MDHWNLTALRAAASRERAAATRELFARFAAWLDVVPTTIRAPQAKERECSGTAY
jgi:hypothetical protein